MIIFTYQLIIATKSNFTHKNKQIWIYSKGQKSSYARNISKVFLTLYSNFSFLVM